MIKYLLFFSTLLVFNIFGQGYLFAQVEKAQYDEALAMKLGADDYGMRSYVMAFLKRGPGGPYSAEERAEIQRGHMAHIQQMADDGKLVLAGPFMDDQEVRGIFLFKVDSIEEAEALTANDPAVIAGTLVFELRPWYGTAALSELINIYPRIQKKKIGGG
jgi:uncharacterized protein